MKCLTHGFSCEKLNFRPGVLNDPMAKNVCDHVTVIGGAVKAGNALTAMAEGYKAALNL